MIIHPGLRALRSDDAPQRDAQERLYTALGAWRGEPDMAAVLAEVQAADAGAALSESPMLMSLFEGDGALPFIQRFLAATIAALRSEPLGHVPLRHFTDGTISTLLLARTGKVSLSIVAIEGAGFAARPEPSTVDFGPSMVWERILAGRADAELVTLLEKGGLSRSSLALAPGTAIRRNAAQEALMLRRVDRCLVSLRLQRREPQAGPTREHALADGRLVHQAAGNPRDSRVELMIALLGRMGRPDAAPMIAALAREPGSMALRWQALRECLALDTREGFAALSDIACAPADELAPMAGALRAQLIEAHPALAEFDPCPA